MKHLLLLALSGCALLATTSTHAHTHVAAPTPERVVPAKVVTFDVMPHSVDVLASTFTGPTAHVSTSHPSVGGFHSTPSYHSYSASPSRPFTFRSSTPSISRPAATSTPRTYTSRISGVPRTKAYTPAPSSSPAEVHHYHSSGGGSGGLSATDLILLNAALNNHQSQGTNTAGSASRYASDGDNYSATETIKEEEGLAGWQICGIGLVVVGILYGCYRYLLAD